MKQWMVWMMTAAVATCGYGNDWPVWRGPGANGISEESGWQPNSAKIAWKKELGEGYSAVSVKGDKLYTMGHKPGADKQGEDVVYCLNAKTGEELWIYSYPATTGQYKGPRATPVLDGELLYTVSQDGWAICINAATGKLIWKVDALSETGNKNIKWGISSSPVIAGELLLLNMGDSGVALKKADGSVVWKSEGTGSYAAPVVFDQRGRKLAAIFSAPGLQVVDALTGEPVSSAEWKTAYEINGADPLIIGEQIFISSGYKKGCALFDFSSGTLKKVWENDLLKTQFSSCVAIDGFVYGVDGQTKSKGTLRCLSAADGSEKWGKIVGFASLMAADGKLIVLNEDGTLLFVEVSPEKYNELFRFETGLDKLCWTAPVLANGMIYCRNDKGTLVAVDVSK